MWAREKFRWHAFHLNCIPAGERKLCRPNFSRKMVERFLSVCLYCVHAEVTASCDAVTGSFASSSPTDRRGICLIRHFVGNNQAEWYSILRTRRDYRMSHAVINHFHPDIALWNLAGFVVHSHNRAERYSLQLYLPRLFPLLIIAIILAPITTQFRFFCHECRAPV